MKQARSPLQAELVAPEGPPEAADPYRRDDEERVRMPPDSVLGRLRYLGPGLVLVASIVGSGELITTTALGAQVGFACLWVILLSCLCKTMILAELARFTISSGETCLTAFDGLPGPRWNVGKGGRPIGWFLAFWLFGALPGLVTSGGIIGAVGQTLNAALPLETGFGLTGERLWCLLALVLTVALIADGRYRLVQRVSVGLVLIFIVTTIICALAIQWTPFAIGLPDLARGLRFELPPEALLLALGAYGATGATAGESMAYSYWCLEKGWAQFIGPPQAGDAWTRRARAWIRVMHLDVGNMMLLFTLATVGFYVLGAGVLHPLVSSGVIPLGPGATHIDGATTMDSLSNIYTRTIGPWGRWLFFVGAFAVLFSTLVAAWAARARFWADVLGVFGLVDNSDYRVRLRWIRIFSVLLPIVSTASYLWVGKVVILLAIGGVVGSLETVVVALATVYLRYRRVDPRIQPGRVADAILWASALLACALGPVVLWSVFAK